MDKGEKDMDRDFLFIQQLVDALSGMQAQLVPNTQEGMLTCIQHIFQGRLSVQQTLSPLLRSLHGLSSNRIYTLNGPANLQFALFSCGKTGQLLVLGPCRPSPLTRAQTAQQLQRLDLKPEQKQEFTDFCLQQPIVSPEALHRLVALLARQMVGSDGPIPFERLDYHWNVDQHLQLLQTFSLQEPEQVRLVEGRYEASALLTEAVKQGNLSLAYGFIAKMATIPDDLNRNPNPLRNAQNFCIVLNTQLRHALEEEGVSPYQLDQLSGSIGRQIEQFQSVAAITAYFSDIIRQYCALAQEKDQRNLSSFSRIAIGYIRSHLSDNLTVKSAAKALMVNPDYLSARFHREVGIPFISYVNHLRIEQAAALLRRTDMQIQQIALTVGYNNASYFARQFQHFMHMTPRAYRQLD